MNRLLISSVIWLAPLFQAHSQSIHLANLDELAQEVTQTHPEWTQIANSLDKLGEEVKAFYSETAHAIDDFQYGTSGGLEKINRINAMIIEHHYLLAFRNNEFRSKLEPLYRQIDNYDKPDYHSSDLGEIEKYLALFQDLANDVDDLIRVTKAGLAGVLASKSKS